VLSTGTVTVSSLRTARRHIGTVLFVALSAASFSRAQPVALMLSSGTAVAGSSVTLSLSLASNAELPAAVQWTLAYSTADFTSPTIAAGPSANAASKQLSCRNTTGSATCILWGLDTTGVPSGVVATVTLPINHTTDSSSQVQLTGGAAAGPAGLSLGTATTGSTVTIQPGLNGFTCNPVAISAPAASSCSVTLTGPALAGGATVGLTASPASAVSLPASVTVPPGSQSATVSVNAGAVATSTPVMLTASYLGVNQGFGITVKPSGSGSSSASFVKLDATTQGNWHGVYGSEGYAVVGDLTSNPSWVTPVTAGASQWVWANSTSDDRALQTASNPSNRVAATWYSNSFLVDLNITDYNTHQIALYSVDFDSGSRWQTVAILDGNGNVLNTQNLTNFTGGAYLVWNVSGHVKIQVTRVNGTNAVASGLFFGGVTSSPTPVISSLNPTSAAVGTPVTISGTNFGTSQGNSKVTFNGTPATPTTWSSTSIVAPVPAGASSGNVVVTVGGVSSNGVAFTVPPAPSIGSLNPTAGEVGTPVTITGTNFGASQGSSRVTFNGTLAIPTGWNATSIVAPVPAGATSGNVVVTVGGLASNGAAFTVSSAPVISSLSPTAGSIGTMVTITGANFGATQGSSSVKFNGTAATPTSWSANSIAVPVPAGATSGNVVVTVGGLPSNGTAFTVATTPVIDSLSPTSGVTGTLVTISGANFGGKQGGSTLTFNGTAAIPASWTATSIVALVPAGATSGNVVVTVGGVVSNGVAFTVATQATPAISSLSPTSGTIGTVVTITGSNFGASIGASKVTFNGTAAAPSSWSANSIAVPVPAGATSGNVVVTVGGVASNGVTFTVVTQTAPVISSLSPNAAPAGTLVTITGSNFGSSQGTSKVTFNGTTATPSSWNAASIVVPVPTGAVSGSVVVTVGGLASNGVQFTVLVQPPTITSLSVTAAPAATPVTITGTNFGAAQGSSTVTFNGTVATPTSWSPTSIEVQVPANATTGNVVVTVGGVPSNGIAFTVLQSPPGILQKGILNSLGWRKH